MPHTKILIIVNRDDAKLAYERALASVGVTYDVAASFVEVQRMCTENAYHGLLIDIQTLVRCNKQEKLIAYNCINLYPAIRLMWDPHLGQIRLSPLEESFSSDPQDTLRYFIEQRCKTFLPRSLRRYPRASVCLNVLLCAGEEFRPDQATKTFTVNISERGAFVHAVHCLSEGETVWLQVAGLSDPSPIRATVRWGIEWGLRNCVCGMGIQFEEMTEQQMKEIRRHIRP